MVTTRAVAVALFLTVSWLAAADRSRPEPPSYRIRPGDTVVFQVLKHPELLLEATVPQSGKLNLPLVGLVHFAGQSPEEASAHLAQLLEERGKLRQPEVVLYVKSYARQVAYIYGAVNSPRELELPLVRPLTLTQAIAAAGGFSVAARRDEVAIFRRGAANGSRRRLVADVTRISTEARTPDPLIEPGDTIYVPQDEDEGAFVLGEVEKPGLYKKAGQFGKPLTLLQAIALAGGYTHLADLRQVRIFRRGPTGKPELLVISAEKVSGSEDATCFALQSGDTVVVDSADAVFVLGEVKNPGAFRPQRGQQLTLAKIVALAGGFTRFAADADVLVARRGENGATVSRTVDVTKISRGKSEDFVLQPGDLVYVPKSIW